MAHEKIARFSTGYTRTEYLPIIPIETIGKRALNKETLTVHPSLAALENEQKDAAIRRIQIDGKL